MNSHQSMTTQPSHTAIGLENDTMSGDDLQKTFETFREQCIWLRCCFNTFQALYETDDETSELLHSTAAHFFHDLNEILREYVMRMRLAPRLASDRPTSNRLAARAMYSIWS